MIRVEKGIPVPGKKYPYLEMEVGDSFLIPTTVKHPAGVGREGRNHAARHGKDMDFKAMKVADGYRCWRIK